MAARSTAKNEALPQVAWGILALAAIITLVRLVLSFMGQDSGLMETLQVVMIFASLIYIVFIAYPRYKHSAEAAQREGGLPRDPLFAEFLSSSTGSSSFWFTVRMYLGFTWLTAGIEKLLSPAWLNGVALKGFWTFASTPPKDPTHAAVAYEWYRQLLHFMVQNQWYTWFTYFVIFGEILIGLGLLFGGLTGIAAFFGALLNFSFGLAGSAGVNPLLLVLAILVVWSWKVAGWYGIDRYLLPRLGTFWQPGTFFQPKPVKATPSSTAG